MELLMLCLKVFCVRIIDVSMGTFRTIVTVKGKKLLASMIGFIEVFIWFVIVKEALNTESTSLFIALAYAGGYATGTFLGSTLSEKFIKGNFGVQVITSKKDDELVALLKKSGFGVSVIDVRSEKEQNEKYMLFIEIDKVKFDDLKKLIKKYDPNAFIVVNETKKVYNGYFTK